MTVLVVVAVFKHSLLVSYLILNIKNQTFSNQDPKKGNKKKQAVSYTCLICLQALN
jgi:hypothetical protein